MKRYRHSILLIFAIFLCIGTFYINSAALANPQFIIKKQSGMENEVRSVAIFGNYQKDRLSDNLMISSNGSIYFSEMSILGKIDKQLFGYDENEKLEKEHRSFMRGKTDVKSLYEDKDSLVYASVSYKISNMGQHDFQFQVSMLEKDTQSENSYKIQLPNENRYLYVSVEDVQIIGNNLKILSQNITADHAENEPNYTERQEVHVYTIDFASKKVIDDKTVLTSDDGNKNLSTNLYMFQETDTTQPNQFVFYYKVTTKHSEQQEEPAGYELVQVNLETNQEKKIAIPKELQEHINLDQLPYYDSKMIYFALETEEGIKVVSFDHSQEKVANSIILNPDQSDYIGRFNFNVKHGKVYVLTSPDSPEQVSQDSPPTTLVVADLETGDQLYKGILTIDDNGNKTSKTDGFVTLHQLIIE